MSDDQQTFMCQCGEVYEIIVKPSEVRKGVTWVYFYDLKTGLSEFHCTNCKQSLLPQWEKQEGNR